MDLIPLVRRIAGVVFPPVNSWSGAIEVSAVAVALPAHLLLRGVSLTVDDTEVLPVFLGGVVSEGLPCYPGEAVFVPIADSSMVSLIAPTVGKDSITVYWWAS